MNSHPIDVLKDYQKAHPDTVFEFKCLDTGKWLITYNPLWDEEYEYRISKDSILKEIKGK